MQRGDVLGLRVLAELRAEAAHCQDDGWIFEGVDGALTVGPNFVHRAGNELFWKSNKHIPQWAAEHIDLILPNSANDFSRVGISVDM